jgi:hypothetical protein
VATNVNGNSPASAPSAAITPSTVPGAPTSAIVGIGPNSVTVSWAAPASNGGAAITGYTVTSAPGGFTCTTTGATVCTVYGLSNGTAYTFTVVATNVNGNSPASAPSATAVPQSLFTATCGPQTMTVGMGKTSITVQLDGASGGTGYYGARPGYGAQVGATLSVTPGEVLTLVVGCAGAVETGGLYGAYGGGGWPGSLYLSGGGGGTFIYAGTTLLAAAGGGGGGAASDGYGGSAGAPNGLAATNGSYPGGGGTQYGGGTAINAQPGYPGHGGQGGYQGSGGGGGYYGGGGGSWAGGGGGSSFVPPGGGVVGGVNNGSGFISITY